MIYRHEPLRQINGIPVFCEHDAYVANYEQIAADHLAHLAATGRNPWQPDGTLLAMEGATGAIVRKYAADGSRILDVGVCLGRLLAPLTTLDRYGVDLAADYLEVAREEGITVALARAEDLPYQDGLFDTVVATDVLEHVLDLHRTVSECLRVLRPGGTLIVRVPREDDLAPYLDSEYDFVHLRRFDVPTLQLLLGRIFTTTIQLISEVAATAEGTTGREIIVATRKP